MDATVLLFVVVALAAGGLIGWLLGSRDGAGARQTVDALRLQLDEVARNETPPEARLVRSAPNWPGCRQRLSISTSG